MRFLKSVILAVVTVLGFAAQAMCISGGEADIPYKSERVSSKALHQVMVDYVTHNKMSAELGGGIYGTTACFVSVSDLQDDGSFVVSVQTVWAGSSFVVASYISDSVEAAVSCHEEGSAEQLPFDRFLGLASANMQLVPSSQHGTTSRISVRDPAKINSLLSRDYELDCFPK